MPKLAGLKGLKFKVPDGAPEILQLPHNIPHDAVWYISKDNVLYAIINQDYYEVDWEMDLEEYWGYEPGFYDTDFHPVH